MKDKIYQILKHSLYPLRAKEIANLLGTDRHSINRLLYTFKDQIFYRDDYYCWSVIKTEDKSIDPAYLIFIKSIIDFKKWLLTLVLTDGTGIHYDSEFFVHISTEQDLIVDFELYMIHFMKYLDYELSDESLQIEDVEELVNYIKPALNYKYRNEDLFRFISTKFTPINDSMEKMLDALIKFDDHHETRKSFIFIRKLRSAMGEFEKLKRNSKSNRYINEILNKLSDFVKNKYDYTTGETDVYIKCTECGDWMTKASSFDQELCFTCGIEKFDRENESTGTLNSFEETSDIKDDFEDNVDNFGNISLKKNITEDCTTCGHKLVCPRAYRNILCEEYKYLISI